MASDMIRPRPLDPGDPAPWFTAPTIGGPDSWTFSSAAGQVSLMLFYGSAANPAARAAIDRVLARRDLFDDRAASFFGVSMDPDDATQARVGQSLPGIRHFLDADGAISALYGAHAGAQPGMEGGVRYLPHFVLLDRTLRVVDRFQLSEAGAALDAVTSAIADTGQDWAPVLTVPRVLEPELCRRMIDLYERGDAAPSGFMREVAGLTSLVVDPGFKRRSDHEIVDQQTLFALRHRLRSRLAPVIQRTFQHEVTRVERYIVACYAAADRGYFHAHRDNTTRGTAHRRFAVTINLNDNYDGGDLRFPEFGGRTYRAPVGGAVVFSCSLLHEATPVTRGRRYAFLPFLYDEAAAKIREENRRFLAESVPAYSSARS